jgi:excisionase family DNA binding protein
MTARTLKNRAQSALTAITAYESDFLKSSEVCKILRISASTLQFLRDTHQIPYYVLGKQYLYKRDEIMTVLNHYPAESQDPK